MVEDDAAVRAHSIEALHDLGYRVLKAEDAESALDMLERHPDVALLFTDIGPPGTMNGRQLADAARERRPGLKVLCTSGYAKDSIIIKGDLAPGVSLIVKPFTYAGLAGKTRAVLAS